MLTTFIAVASCVVVFVASCWWWYEAGVRRGRVLERDARSSPHEVPPSPSASDNIARIVCPVCGKAWYCANLLLLRQAFEGVPDAVARFECCAGKCDDGVTRPGCGALLLPTYATNPVGARVKADVEKHARDCKLAAEYNAALGQEPNPPAKETP